jgi:hypothetical protein
VTRLSRPSASLPKIKEQGPGSKAAGQRLARQALVSLFISRLVMVHIQLLSRQVARVKLLLLVLIRVTIELTHRLWVFS